MIGAGPVQLSTYSRQGYVKLVDIVSNHLKMMVVEEGCTELTVQNVVKQTGLEHLQVVSIFQNWEKNGLGRFIKGSRGGQSRFETAALLFLRKPLSTEGLDKNPLGMLLRTIDLTNQMNQKTNGHK